MEEVRPPEDGPESAANTPEAPLSESTEAPNAKEAVEPAAKAMPAERSAAASESPAEAAPTAASPPAEAAAPAESKKPVEAPAQAESKVPTEAAAPNESKEPTDAPVAAASPASGAPAEVAAPEMPSKAAEATPKPNPKPGARLKGTIVQIGEGGVFVDFGGREEAVLDVREITDESGAQTKKVGDKIQATVTSVSGGVKLSMKGKTRSGDLPALLEAAKTGVPIQGKVTGTNKGGLVIHTLGLRAFCPFSQIDRHYVENPEQFVGKTLTFRVSSSDEKGRNIVLSRRSLLEEEAKAGAEELRQKISVGTVLEGKVVRIRPFGAFVDLGGIDGLIHVSEVSHARVKDPGQALSVGQTVKVEIVKVEDLGGPKERISLSRKKFAPDPWADIEEKVTPGSQIKGKVVRIVDFGAFVEIQPGVDGLVHVSALAEGRVEHPSKVVAVGDEVEAWVLNVNPESRRISLSLVDPALHPQEDHFERGGPRPSGGDRRPRKGRQGGRDSRDSRESGALREYRETVRSSDTGMTSMEEAFQRLREKQ